MGKQIVNTFVGGMNKDIDKSLISSKSYLDAHNFRSITTKGGTTGSLENIKGNYLLSGVGGNIDAGQFIIGTSEIRDKLVLFTTNNTSTTPNGGNSQIYVMELDLETETQTSLTKIYDDNLNAGLAVSDFLNFSTAYPIKAIARYETPNIQKIYWTDGYNNLRYINIVNDLTISGLPYAIAGDYMSVDKFESSPNITVVKPTLYNVVGGRIKTGIVAYAYQLYIMNGAESVISPISDPIHVVVDNDFLADTRNYGGDTEPVNSGKGFIIRVNNQDSGYNRLRLIRLQYYTINSIPEIIIAKDIDISTSPSIISITDAGDTVGELTLDEFNLSSTELFICQDIASKDNRLFAANISKSEFTVSDWDARAVRFKAGSNSVLLDSAGAPSTVTIIPPVDPDIPADWDTAGWDDYVEDHDGINSFNNPTYDGNVAYQYMYQSDGTTLGAEGKNVKIDFETEIIELDTSNSNTTFYATPPTDGTDLSYKSYASIWKGGKLSWQRDEVYRLFVVFGNNRGQVSDPKWICDLRMPSLHDATYSNLSTYHMLTGIIDTERLYPRILFKSFPTNATWAQIHRVKRDRQDRFVVAQGLAIPTYDGPGTNYKPSQLLDPLRTTDGVNLVKLVSPDININKNVSKQATDYIEYVTNFSGDVLHVTRTTEVTVIFRDVFKLKTNNLVAYSDNTKSNIEDAFVITPASTSVDYVTIDGKTYSNYSPVSWTKGSTGLLISYTNDSWSAEGESFVIVNYKSNVYGSQYGGHTNEDRMRNISIPCSDVIPYTSVGYNDINYGDTFLNYFDVNTGLYDLAGVATSAVAESAYVVLESSINSDLRHDTSSAHIVYTNELSALTQEYAGTHMISVGPITLTYEQADDLYGYNTVYSQQIDAKPAISLVVDKILETEFDCMIKASNYKNNGEITDSWTKFGVNEFIEVDTIYGPINALYTYNNKLIYFQDKAFGLASVNDRSLINDTASAQLVLGTGGVLDRFDYVSTNTGCQDKFSVVSSKMGVYWYDRLLNFIDQYSTSLTNLTKVKMIQSYFDNSTVIADTFKAHAYADTKNDEILFSFLKESVTNGFTISYNELVDSFVSFYDFVPTIYVPYNQRYLTTTSTHYNGSGFDRNRLFLHDSDIADRAYFYGLTADLVERYVNSTLTILFNPEYESTKVFDSLFYISNASSTTADIFYNTFSYIRCYNDFQNTSTITLTPSVNIERREREWTLVIPRNAVNANVSTNPNITIDVDTNQLFKERMRDKYLIGVFTYINDGSYDKFTVTNMGLRYRTSFR